MLFSNDDDDI